MGAAPGRDFEVEWPKVATQLHAMLAGKRVPKHKREDLVQETGLRLFRMWSQVDPERPVWPLAVTITLNLLRDEARRPGREVLGDIPDRPADLDVERTSFASLELKRVWRAMADLSPSHRSALLVELGQAGEVAERGPAAAKMLRLRARRKLSAALESVSVGGGLVVFRIRRMLASATHMMSGKVAGWSNEQLAPAAGAVIVLGLALSGLAGSGIDGWAAAPTELRVTSDAPTAVSSEEASPSSPAAHVAAGTLVERGPRRSVDAARDAGPRGSEDPTTLPDEDDTLQVPVGSAGYVEGGGRAQVEGYGAEIGDQGNGTPVCLVGVNAMGLGCEDQEGGTHARLRAGAKAGGLTAGTQIEAGA